jgi:uncharacterized protein (TIGR03663 family)
MVIPIICLFLHTPESRAMAAEPDPPNSRTETVLCAVLFAVAVLVAVWLRFDQISIKPFHHDEGVNSYFLLNMAKPNGEYRYNPENYHGPSLYYVALAAMTILGKTELALRSTPALFGVLSVLLLWPLRRHLGTMGTPAAGFFMALSPGLVYFSRDFIHEMSFGCFVLGVVVGAWRFAETKRFRWLALAAFSLGLMAATKETVVVNVIVLIALVCAAVWDAARSLRQAGTLSPGNLLRTLTSDAATVAPTLDHACTALIIVIFLHIFLYSSLFRNWQGPLDFFRSVLHWTQERSAQDHVHPFYYYFGILLKLELPLVIGSLLAGAAVVWKGTRFWLFLGAATLGTFLAYSIIPYKTPWLMVSMLVMMAVMCGYAMEQGYRLFAGRLLSLRLLWSAAAAALLLASGQMAWLVNFEKYDDNTNESGYFRALGKRLAFKPYVDGQYGYVYAQTDRDLLFLLEAIRSRAERLPTGTKTGIYVASPDYWPLPWYLREYELTAFSGAMPAGDPPQLTQPLIIARESQRAQLDALPNYRAATQPFKLRPGVELLLYERVE